MISQIQYSAALLMASICIVPTNFDVSFHKS